MLSVLSVLASLSSPLPLASFCHHWSMLQGTVGMEHHSGLDVLWARERGPRELQGEGGQSKVRV